MEEKELSKEQLKTLWMVNKLLLDPETTVSTEQIGVIKNPRDEWKDCIPNKKLVIITIIGILDVEQDS